MAKKKGEDEPCGNWMDTYGDMVTLLLTFFVLLFSMSSVSEEKFATLVRAFTSAEPDTINVILDQSNNQDGMEFPTNRGDNPPSDDTLANTSLEELEQLVPNSFDELYLLLKTYVEKSGMESSVQVSRQGDGSVFIRFEDNVFFNPDSDVIRTSSEPLLDFLGNCLKSVEDQILTVNINGHTADPGIANYHVSDWRLSSERASSVAIYLEEKKGFDPKKLLPIGYGKNYPIAPNDTAEGRRQNRRVDMLILSKDSSLSDQEILQSILEGTFNPNEYPEQGTLSDVLVPEGTSSEEALPAQTASSQEQTSDQIAPLDAGTTGEPGTSVTPQLSPPPSSVEVTSPYQEP